MKLFQKVKIVFHLKIKKNPSQISLCGAVKLSSCFWCVIKHYASCWIELITDRKLQDYRNRAENINPQLRKSLGELVKDFWDPRFRYSSKALDFNSCLRYHRLKIQKDPMQFIKWRILLSDFRCRKKHRGQVEEKRHRTILILILIQDHMHTGFFLGFMYITRVR